MKTQTNPVNWFEIPVNDLRRAKRFYESVLGIELTPKSMGPKQMAWFPMMPEAPGASGALVHAQGYAPSPSGALVYFRVGDIEAVLAKADSHGGRTLLPKKAIGEHGFVAQIEDCEGNRLALHSDR